MSDDLFEFPGGEGPIPAPLRKPRQALALVPDSFVCGVINKKGQTIRYARLADSQHDAVVKTVKDLHRLRDELAEVFALLSPLWGERVGVYQTYGEVIAGMLEKSTRRHPIHKQRIGEDYTVKQLNVLNDLIDALNSACGDEEGSLFPLVIIPFDK